jgi:hypothetical protein
MQVIQAEQKALPAYSLEDIVKQDFEGRRLAAT